MEGCKMGEAAAMKDFCSRMMGGGAKPAAEPQGLDEKTRELIAIGASVGAHCQPCLDNHVAKARELGVEEEMIRAAIETGHMVEKGAMVAMRKFSADLLQSGAACQTGGGLEADTTTRQQSGSCCG